MANSRSGTACSYVIIIGHINIEHELSLGGVKVLRLDGVVIFGGTSKHGPDIDLMWLSFLNGSNKFVLIFKRLVSNIDVVFNGERPLAFAEEVFIHSLDTSLRVISVR